MEKEYTNIHTKYFAATNAGDKFGEMQVNFNDAKDDAIALQKKRSGTWFVAEIKSHYIINEVKRETVVIGGVRCTF